MSETTKINPVKFRPGRIGMTPAAMQTMELMEVNPVELLARHLCGDWGDVDQEDAETNDQALTPGEESRILSVYGGEGNPDRLYIITEWDRSQTTILRADEY